MNKQISLENLSLKNIPIKIYFIFNNLTFLFLTKKSERYFKKCQKFWTK